MKNILNTCVSESDKDFVLATFIFAFSYLVAIMKFVRTFIVFSAIFSLSYGLKVLGILPFFGKSHFAIGHSIVKSLHDAGHEITVWSPFPNKSPIANYTDIVLEIPDFMNPEKGNF